MRNSLSIVAILALSISSAFAQGKAKPSPTIEKSSFGKTADGKEVWLFTMTNSNGLKAKITTYGGIITELWVPDRNGKFADVVLGHDSLKGYLDGHPYFGCITGRVANRIAKGKFTLDGKEYTLATNNSPNHLHGGKIGFDKINWTASSHGNDNHLATLTLKYRSKDGEEGYPGNLDVIVTCKLTNLNALEIEYIAIPDKATPVNLTNHSYFNLAGHNSGDILGHRLELFADKYTPTDDTLIPTGKIEPVKDTPYDFTAMKEIGRDIKKLKGDPVGYDVNYVLRQSEGKDPKPAARVIEPKSGRIMEVLTTEPGVQLYTSNFLDGKDKGKGGAVYKQYAALCLETQQYPDAVNQKNFPSVIVKPGGFYQQKTIYRFSTGTFKK